MPDYSIVLTCDCAFCGRSFTYRHSRRSNPPRRYCSEQCRRIGSHLRRVVDSPCAVCANPIRAVRKRAAANKTQTCSMACSLKLRFPDVEARLLAKTKKTESCWLWQGGIGKKNGYGFIRDNGKRDYVHRVAYRLWIGPIPDGTEIDHLCHNADPMCSEAPCPHRRCVNPLHLEAVPHRVNALRGKGAYAKKRRMYLARTGRVDTLAPAM